MTYFLIAMIMLFPLGGADYLRFSQAYLSRRGEIRHGHY
jgi:hypothetical protein